jgi:2-polyprenyl-3-methyl-5-hydroxy-6-metoxy-1,4-benzoquinol methylase
MTTDKLAALDEATAAYPSLRQVAGAVIEVWPAHVAYLLKSISVRSPAVLAASETAANAAVLLADGRLKRFATDYHWTCNQVREEELFFFREDRYRLSTFQEAYDQVYSNGPYMEKYMNGLLISNVLWSNHAAIFEMFINRVLGSLKAPVDYLEVGPGHGLMLSFAAQSAGVRSLEAWDVSDTSLRETRAALDRLAVDKPVKMNKVDIINAPPTDRKFGLIVFSEILEHLEKPKAALAGLRSAVSEDGRVFINVPLNSPAPDHIFLLAGPEEVREVIEGEGFRVESIELYATQGAPIERALEDRISVSAGVVARPR